MKKLKNTNPVWAWDIDYRKLNKLCQKDIYWLKWKYERILLYGRDRDFKRLEIEKLKKFLPQLNLPEEYKWLLTRTLYH